MRPLFTAGVYLMVRTASLLSEAVVLIGALTALMAGLFGLYQSDMKRVIAYSTCSQLGYAPQKPPKGLLNCRPFGEDALRLKTQFSINSRYNLRALYAPVLFFFFLFYLCF